MKIPSWVWWAAAAYLLFKPKEEGEGPAAIPPKPAPKPAVHGVGGWAYAPVPLTLQPNTRYFARISLSPDQASHSSMIIRGAIKAGLEHHGFSDVYVWMTTAPAGMPTKPTTRIRPHARIRAPACCRRRWR